MLHARLSTGELLAAIPAILGFRPADSVVFLAFTDQPDGTRRLHVAGRADLADVVHGPPDHLATCLAPMVGDQLLASLVCVVVHKRQGTDLPYRDELALVADSFLKHGVRDVELLFLPSFDTGVTWSCYLDRGHTGTLPDVAASAVTAVVVASGNRIYSSRAEFTEQFTPAPEQDLAAVARLVPPHVHAAELEDLTDDRTALSRRLARLENAITAAEAGDLPHDHATIADLVAAFTSLRIRDSVLVHDSQQRARAAEELCLHLWRHAPRHCGIVLAGTIATMAYLRGDRVAAGLIAETSPNPDTLTELIMAAVANALHPDKVRDILRRQSRMTRAELTAPLGPRSTPPAVPASDQGD
ncbi:DUF4192 domain-containing protein [Amycolatopsis sp. lyj-112]|uniref:DUF4192 domain-containing protein n=1 Tax=Amycolatopsis sp. lyj-112 TaxID=2789288 RepID=UPI00397C4C13